MHLILWNVIITFSGRMKYPRPVFSKCPYRKNVPICRIADHTVLVEDSHDFLYEEMLKLLNLFRHGSQQSCCNGNQHAYSFSNQTCNLYNWNKLLKYLWGCRSTFLSKFQAFFFELPGVFLMILMTSFTFEKKCQKENFKVYVFKSYKGSIKCS